MSGKNHSSIEIRLLGRFDVSRGKKTLSASGWQRRKAATLLQRLALEKRLLRDEVLEFLWPEAEPDAAANNLYRTLYNLRQTLDESLGDGAAAATFMYSDRVLRLAEDVWVDVHVVEKLFRRQTITAAQLEEALALYQGPLLPDSVYDDWTAPPRQALQRHFRDLCLHLADEATGSRDIEVAIDRLRPFLDDDPADEVIHRQLMRLFARLGRRHDALRQYEACVQALDDELGVPPTPQTVSLHEQILRDELYAPVAEGNSSKPASPLPPAVEISPRSPFFGRQAELDTLTTLLREVAAQSGKTALIKGVTGVGKTRLAREVLHAAAAMKMVVLSGAAYEFEGRLAYQPFAEAIDRYLAEVGRPLTENPLTHFTPARSGDPQQEKWSLFSSTGAFFAELATENPVVLFVDDLHAADEASLQLFHYLARHTRSRRFLLLATFRTDIIQARASPFSALLNALYREGLRETVALEPLEPATIAELVGQMHDGDIDPSLIEVIVDAAEGNPFFAEEMCGALLRSEQVVHQDGAWRLKAGVMPQVPSDLRELLQERIAQSGFTVASTLEVGAVIGRSFSFEILRRVPMSPDVDLIGALDIALKAGLIEAVNDDYRFRHGLTRHALYQAISHPRRRRLNRLVAEAIENTLQSRQATLGAHVEALVHHYERSDRVERALPYLVKAGQRAADRYAFEGAIDYYERALALMDDQALEDDQQRWQLLESLGWWEKIVANTPRSVAHFERALALSPGGSWQPDPNDRARLHAGAAMALLTAGDTKAAEAHLNAAQEQIDEQAYASEYADILYNVAQLHWHRNEYDQAFEVAQRSLQIAERLDDSTAVARAFEMLALACHSLGEWQMGLDFEEQRSAIAGPELDVSDAFDVHL